MEGTPAGRLIGREAQVRELESVLRELGERATTVAITGEPGSGKTRLLQELVDRAREQGRRVIDGRGTEFEQGVPFGLAIDALDDSAGGLDPARLDGLGSERLAELASVFPSLSGRGGSLSTELQAERYRCYYAVGQMLEDLASEGPLIVALDDVHWADRASSELILHLLRRPPGASVLLCLAYRPHQAPGRLRSAVAGVVRNGRAIELEVEPLTEAEAEELLGPGVEKSRRRALYRESGGNPFYLIELTRSVGAASARAGARAGQVDAAVRDVLRRGGLVCPHHTGHGVGAAPQEVPWLVPGGDTVLEENMVVAIEPGAYEDGFGVRLEHLAVVGADGASPLTSHSLDLL